MQTPLCDRQAVRCRISAMRPQELAQQERRFGRAAGTLWTTLELSPGDSSLVHRGRMTVATAALGGPAMGELLSAGRLGAERHRLDAVRQDAHAPRSEEHTSELQSLMRTSYAVFCLTKKKNTRTTYKQQTEKSSTCTTDTQN